MGKNQSASGLINVIQYDSNGNVSIVSGSTTLMQVSSSGQIYTTGTISGSSVQSASLAQNSNLLQGTGSVGFVNTGSFSTTSGSVSSRITQIENVYATTGSNSFTANQSITGSLTVSSTLTAQTLVVQTVTSSIVYSSGSNVFGCDINSRQTFTGSLYVTGSNVFINSANTCFRCVVCVPSLIASSADTTGTNVAIVNTSTGGTYWNLFSGGSANSLGAAGSLIFRDSTNGATRMVLTQGGNLGIGCDSPGFKLDAYSSAAGTATIARFGAANYGNASYKTYIQIGTQYLDGSSRIGSSNPSGNLSELFFETADSVSGNFNERLRISSSGIACFQNVVCACSFASATPSLTRDNLNITRATKVINSFNATASGARWLRVGCFDARTTYLMSFGTTGNYYTPGSTTFLMFRDWGNGFFTSTLGKLGEQYVFCARMQSDNVGSQYALEVWMNSITADQLNGVLVYSAATLAGNPDTILMCLGSYGTSLSNAANTSTAIAL